MRRGFNLNGPYLSKNFRRAFTSYKKSESNNFLIENLPTDLDCKALLYKAPDHLFSIDNKEKLYKFRIYRDLIKSPTDLAKVFSKYKENPRNSEYIYSSSIPIEDLLQDLDPNLYKSFLDKLNPIATNILKLEENKKNLELYNYSIPSPQLNLEKNSYDNAVRDLSKALYFLPVLKQIRDYDNEKGQDLLDSLVSSTNNSKLDSLNEVLNTPNANFAFYRRIGGMNQYQIKKFHDLFYDHDLTGENQNYDKKFANKISSIPIANSVNKAEHDEFIKFVKFCEYDKSFSDKAKQAMFNKITTVEKNWSENSNIVFSNDFKQSQEEYFSSIAVNLILPHYIEEFNKEINSKNNNPKSKTSLAFPDKYEHWLVKYVKKEITFFLKDALIKPEKLSSEEYSNYLTPKELYQYAKEHENRASGINAQKPLLLERLKKFEENKQLNFQWAKAFEDIEIDGVKFCCLVNEKELKEEAEFLRHCAEGYGQICNEGLRHIVSGIVEETGERFTLRFSSFSNKLIYDETVTKKENGERVFLSEKAKDAINTLLKKIDSKEIIISNDLGNLNKNLTISEAVGYDISSKEDYEKLFEAYKLNKILPTKAQSITDFLDEINIKEFLKNNLEEHVNLLSNNPTIPSLEVSESIGIRLQKPREYVSMLD